MRRLLAVLLALAGLVLLPACTDGSSAAGGGASVPAGAREVVVETADGVRLEGFALGTGPDVAVLSHGATGTKEGFTPLAQAFADAGWTAIAYDARGVGGSGGERDGDRRPDLRAVVAQARADGARRVVLVGASMGGGLSLALAGELDADGVVSLSSPAGAYDAAAAVGSLRGTPLLFVAAAGDHPYVDDARAMAAAAGVTPVVVDGDRHGTGMFLDHPDLAGRIVAFARTV